MTYNENMNKYKIILVLIIILVVGFLVFKKEPVENENSGEIVVNVPKITYTNTTPDMIEVELPHPGAVTGKEFSVIGRARGGWYFEASAPIELLDKDGKLIANSYVQAQGEWMTSEFVPFKGEIKAPESYIGPATLVLRKDNASGLPEHDASISFPITVEY